MIESSKIMNDSASCNPDAGDGNRCSKYLNQKNLFVESEIGSDEGYNGDEVVVVGGATWA